MGSIPVWGTKIPHATTQPKEKQYSDLFASLIMKDDVTDIIVQIFICTQKTGF